MALVSEYCRDMQKSELLLYEEEEKTLPAYYESMLLYNEINGILRFHVQRIDRQVKYAYEVTGQLALSLWLETKKLSFEKLRSLLTEIVRIVNNSREFLIDERDFLLQPDYIFIQPECEEIRLCCLPGYQKELKEQIAALLEHLMNKIDYNDKRAVVAVYALYMKSKEEICTFDEIIRILNENEGPESANGVANGEPESSGLVETTRNMQGEEPRSGKKSFSEADSAGSSAGSRAGSGTGDRYGVSAEASGIRNKSVWQREGNDNQKHKWSMNSGKDNKQRKKGRERNKEQNGEQGRDKVLDESSSQPSWRKRLGKILQEWNPFAEEDTEIEEAEKTLLLYRPENKALYRLQAEDNQQETIYLSRFPFYIGKAGANVNHEIRDPAISRMHAKLLLQEGSVYLEDMQSTNGCFVNGTRLSGQEAKELKEGDEVILAERRYRFAIH